MARKYKSRENDKGTSCDPFPEAELIGQTQQTVVILDFLLLQHHPWSLEPLGLSRSPEVAKSLLSYCMDQGTSSRLLPYRLGPWRH